MMMTANVSFGVCFKSCLTPPTLLNMRDLVKNVGDDFESSSRCKLYLSNTARE